MEQQGFSRTDIILAAVAFGAGVVLLLFPVAISPMALSSLSERAGEIPVITQLYLRALTPPVMAVLCVSLLPLSFIWKTKRTRSLAASAGLGWLLVLLGLVALFVLPS